MGNKSRHLSQHMQSSKKGWIKSTVGDMSFSELYPLILVISGILICDRQLTYYLTFPAYILYFSSLSALFWLNVTCFDIWWTFRGVCSYRTNIKHHEKKKFVIYSIYAWGIAFIFTVVCAIMDYAPVPKNWIRPEMCKKKFCLGERATTIYFTIPMCAIVISNICFFIATTLTILYQDKRTAHQLRNSESRCHDENKQRFTMYLKLFIVMGMTWIMDILSWFINDDFVSPIIWYPTDMLNALQGLIIFIIFVCKKKILRLLLKRIGCQNRGTFCKISRNNDCSITTTSFTSGSGTGTETGTVFMQEISPSNQQTNYRAESD